MLLDGMVGVLETLRERIQNHRKALEGNEMRTRMALIDPLLQVLGWEPANPDLVRPEHSLNSGKGYVDYALLGADGQPVVFIEAKKLNEPLAMHVQQMVTYATMEGIAYAGLTNGNRWEFYKIFDQKPLMERCVLSVSVDRDNIAQCALRLLWLWRSNLAGSSPVQSPEPFIHDHGVVDPSPEGWIPLCELDLMPGARAPSSIRFPDGKEYPTNSTWTQMLEQAVHWLFDHGYLTPAAMPVPNASRTRFLISIEQHKQRDGKTVLRQRQINGFWLYTKLAPQQVRHQILYLVATYYGQEKSDQYRDFRDIWVPASSPSPTTSTPTTHSEGWIPLCELDLMPGTRAPSSIRFPDGKEYPTNSAWNQMLVQTVHWLFDRGHLASVAMPVSNASGTRPLISVEQHKQRDGKIVSNQHQVNGFWLYTSFSSQDARRHILYLVAYYYGQKKSGSDFSDFRDIWVPNSNMVIT